MHCVYVRNTARTTYTDWNWIHWIAWTKSEWCMAVRCHRINSWCNFAHYRSHIYVHQMSRVSALCQFGELQFKWRHKKDCIWLICFKFSLWPIFAGVKDENIYHRRVCATNHTFRWTNHNRICLAICCIRTVVRPTNQICSKMLTKKVDYCGPRWLRTVHGILLRGASNDIQTMMIIMKSSTITIDRLYGLAKEHHGKFQLR